jgi:hypothetical protein
MVDNNSPPDLMTTKPVVLKIEIVAAIGVGVVEKTSILQLRSEGPLARRALVIGCGRGDRARQSSSHAHQHRQDRPASIRPVLSRLGGSRGRARGRDRNSRANAEGRLMR